MNIPEKVKAALKTVGLNSYEWRLIHSAFEGVPDLSGAQIQECARILGEAAQLVNAAKNLSIPTPGIKEGSWDEMTKQLFLRSWDRFGDEGAQALGFRLGIGKTTIYRYLRDYGIPRSRRGKADKPTIFELEQQIERLSQQLAAMKAPHEVTP